MVAVICLIVASTTYVIGQMTGVGVAFGRFLEVSNTTGLLDRRLRGLCLRRVRRHEGRDLHPGGAILRSDHGLYHPGHLHLAAADRQSGSGARPVRRPRCFSGEPLLSKLDAIVTELGFNEYTAHHSDTFNMVLFTLSLMIGTAGLPHVIMRFFTVPKVADARWSAGWALVFIALLYLTAPAVGAMARLNITEMMWPNGGIDGGAVTVQQIEDDPQYDWMATWQKTGLSGLGRQERRRCDPVLQRQERPICRKPWLRQTAGPVMS